MRNKEIEKYRERHKGDVAYKDLQVVLIFIQDETPPHSRYFEPSFECIKNTSVLKYLTIHELLWRYSDVSKFLVEADKKSLIKKKAKALLELQKYKLVLLEAIELVKQEKKGIEARCIPLEYDTENIRMVLNSINDILKQYEK